VPVTVLPSRRGVLRAAAGAPIVLLVACSNDAESQPTDADDSVRSEVANNEQQLISRYDATIAAYPALASKLTPLRDQHAQHLSAMGTQPASNDGNSPTVGKTSAAAVAELTAAERRASTERVKSSGQAAGADLIWNLALIAASESQHAAVLAKGSA